MRKTSLAAGVAYVITFSSIPTLALYTDAHQADYILGVGRDSRIILGGILELLVGMSGIATAVILYPVLKKQNHSMSLGLVTARVVEAALIFAGVATLFTLVSLRQSGIGEAGLATGQALVTLYDKFFLVSQSFMPAVCDLLLGLLLWHSRLVPRWLAAVGILGAPVLLGYDAAMITGNRVHGDPIAMLTAIPVAFFEFTLGIWMIAKGFNSAPKNEQNVE